jgi:hypothetical protein
VPRDEEGEMAESAMIQHPVKSPLYDKLASYAADIDVDIDKLYAEFGTDEAVRVELKKLWLAFCIPIMHEQNAYIEQHGIPLEELSVQFGIY